MQQNSKGMLCENDLLHNKQMQQISTKGIQD